MSFRIREIQLELETFNRFTSDPEKRRIANLSKVNVFVGPNNSGKSRFLRALASIKEYVFKTDSEPEALRGIKDELVTGLVTLRDNLKIKDVGGLVKEAGQLPQLLSITEGKQICPALIALVEKIRTIAPTSLNVEPNFGGTPAQRLILESLRKVLAPIKEQIEALRMPPDTKYEFKRVYIPTLRGLRKFDEVNADIYSKRTRADYFKDESQVAMFTGQTFKEDITHQLLGTLANRTAIAEFQEFLSASFFDGQPVALIPRYQDAALAIKIGDETERPLSDLGDGIQSIIILTYPLFQYHDKNLLLFIEEPELYLHPGLQRMLMEVLIQRRNVQSFLVTHSNHLLDLTLDIDQVSVYSFHKELEEGEKKEKNAKVTVVNLSNDDDRSLQLLGVQNSAVFLSNCTVWVEGITDRRYFSKYLAKYRDHLEAVAEASGTVPAKRFKQDLHYSFVEYAGANITHFSFLDVHEDPIVVERLCAKLFLITDKDKATDVAKADRHKALREKLGDRYCCLESREVENLLTPEVIKAVVKSYEGDDVEFKDFSQADYQSESLGKFIHENILQETSKKKGSYAAASGTISDKITFCQKALENIETFNDLSEEAKRVTEQIYEFIQQQNK
jgi:AAA ATPase domain